MGKSLVIVESPAKIKTLQKFLGSGYIFESSLGHVRDLPEDEFGIDVDNDFDPVYKTIKGKKQVIDKLKKRAKECDTVYLCPDPDREGEAIAWHIAAILPKGPEIKRAAFTSITRQAVIQSLENPHDIDYSLVNAQQARRLLDRIVGYKISPILARRIQRAKGQSVSAGRVQSVALKLVVDRENEIEAFNPVEFWNLNSWVTPSDESEKFSAHLYSVDGRKVEKEAAEGKDYLIINNKEDAEEIRQRLEKGEYRVAKVEKKEKRRNPVPPFITSTLQQEASRHHRYSSSKTMQIAQTLYEGIDMGNEGTEGLITYMRTDSVRVSPEALRAARGYIKENYGDGYLPATPRYYSAKKSAQDAHEAIRPTNLYHPPEAIKQYLTRDQYNLYSLIWKRFIASQMNPAVYDTVSADIATNDGIILRASGSIRKFAGFLAVYQEKGDDEPQDDGDNKLPSLEENQPLNLLEVTAEQSFTKPPPRYSEASLVKELEKSGVGRPSTYAAIMNKIHSREYTEKNNNRLAPTELGRVVVQMLEANFPSVMNIDFTAHMEDDLELIAEDSKEWKEVIREFWEAFIPMVEKAKKEAFVPKVETEHKCPKCGSNLQKVWSRSKYFYGCTGYPECDYTAANLDEVLFSKKDYAADFDWEQPCPLCGSEMNIRHGRFGTFLGCSKYPECRGIVNVPKKGEAYIPPKDMPPCPAKGCEGHLLSRKSRFGKTFFSCSSFPDCDVIGNDLDAISAKYADHPKTPYKKKTAASKKETTKKKGSKKEPKKKSSKPRNMPPCPLSPELSAVVGVEELPRNKVMAKVWEYIKGHDCQDPKDKRIIIPDEKLATLFGSKEPVQMLKIAGIISKHIKKAEK
ncbi:MAG: type I DNA topoisomerase [Chlamydiota bacterium]